jgi:membrane associated rhomboid family serine protease
MNPYETPQQKHPLEDDSARPRPPVPAPQPGTRLVMRGISGTPYVTYALIAINVVIFIVRALLPDVEFQTLLQGANSAQGVFRDGEYYRFFTSMFLHASIHDPTTGAVNLSASMHLIFNMYALYFAGGSVERLNGHTRFILIYLLGGLSGSLLSAAMGTRLSVGASGAVFGVFAAQLDFFLRHRAVFGAYGQAQIRSLTTLVLMNLALGLLVPRIDNWAHIGGAIGGYIASRFGGARFEVRQSETLPAVIAQPVRSERESLTALVGIALLWVAAVLVAASFYRG